VRDAVIGVEEAWACGAGLREGVVDGGVRGVISGGGVEEVDGDGRGRGGGGVWMQRWFWGGRVLVRGR